MPIPDNKNLKALIKINTEGVPALKEQCHSNTTIPMSAKAGPLGTYWKARLDELEPNKYHRAVKKDEVGMLGHLGNYLADDAGKVIDFVLRHWTDFGWQALNNAGVKSHPPEEPNIGFLLKYHVTAVNMMLNEMQSIAKQKPSEEAKAEKAIQATEPKKPAKVLTIQETPIIKLGFTPEQLHLLLDIDADHSFSDKVTQKYGDNWQPASLGDKDSIPCEIDFELAG